ncbi:hypothetical protein [Lactobacillus helveticus]|uniref:hypothetical protein n=2 Tax=Lactobacillus helveticus TaxID=1587 RepID=UPI001566D852|nr:hypothetical protein [Lactobacillus helveticus]
MRLQSLPLLASIRRLSMLPNILRLKLRQFQRQYYSLSKIKYTKQNIYQQQPNFGLPFSAGVLNPTYIPDTMDYVNYYRSLAGLPTELKVHGLLGYMRPFYFNKKRHPE